MKASMFAGMGYSQRATFPSTWPVSPVHADPETSVQSYREGMEECELAEDMGFDWLSFSEHHYSGRIATGTPAVAAAAVAERCKNIKIALLGHLLPLNNPVRVAEELALLDNLSNGRVVAGFLRGTPNEDQVYTMNPAEGRGRLLESMDLILKALTEPEPFSWEGRYYQYRTVAVWPRVVQQPLPQVVVGTRSDDTVRYAAEHRLGLGVSFLPVEETAKITDKYHAWCAEAGWTPGPDDIVYRGSLYLAETDELANEWYQGLMASRPGPNIPLRRTVAEAIQAARVGNVFDLRGVVAGSPEGDVVGNSLGINFLGGPDTVAKQIKEFHDRCGVGVIDMPFQQNKVDHKAVLKEIELFGKEVIPQLREFK